MKKRNEAKPIQGWGWLGDAAEEAAVQPTVPARCSKNASTATASMKPKQKRVAARASVPASGGTAQTSDDDYRQLAKEQYESEGKIEIDPNAKVSRSEDHTGEIRAWVQAWVFVKRPERT